MAGERTNDGMPRAAVLEEQGTAGPAGLSPGASARRRRDLRAPSMGAVLGLGIALVAWMLELRPLADNSFLWHLATGHWILDHGIPSHDIFSFTAENVAWVNQSWLAEVVYAGVDRALGPFGLRLLRAGTSALIAYLAFSLALRLVGDRTRAVLLTAAALGGSVALWTERPLLFGALAMVVLVWVVEVPDSLAGRHPLISVPVVMWLWANMHGSFALGFGFLGLHLAGRWLDGAPPWRSRERALLLAAVIAFIACLANPVGLSLVTFPLHMLGRGEVLEAIREWGSPDFRSLRGMLFGLWIAVFTITVARAGTPTSRRDLLVGVVFLLLALWALRNMIVAPLVGLPIVARALAVDRRPDPRVAFNWVVAALIVILGAGAAQQATARADFDFSAYPVAAITAVEDSGLIGARLFTSDEWAAYLIHRYWPEQRVFIDDRYDMYPVRLAKDYFALLGAQAEWEEILDRHDVEVVVWGNEHPLGQYLDGDSDWARVHRDDRAGVWVRTPIDGPGAG